MNPESSVSGSVSVSVSTNQGHFDPDTDPDADPETAELIWYHALAIGYAPAYLAENADGIRQDWPRIPLPGFGGPTSVSSA